MTTFTWNAMPGSSDDWDAASSWLGDAVPNAPDADAVLPYNISGPSPTISRSARAIISPTSTAPTIVIEEGGGADAIWGGTGGALFVENFGNGDVLDLSQIMPLAADLSNIGNFVNVVAAGPDDDVVGVADGGMKTVLQVVGTSGTAYVNLENVGSLNVAGLLAENALILPPH